MERLTVDDRVILWPDALWPQEVGAILLLDGAQLLDAAGGVRVEEVRSLLAGRLWRVPRLRQVLRVPHWGLGPPLWVDAASFDIAQHVGVCPVPPPGDEAALLTVVEDIRSRPLDRSRPLWEIWLLPGLTAGRVGAFVRLHHVMADGMAAISMLGLLLGSDAATQDASKISWHAREAPSSARLLADNLSRYLAGLSKLLYTLTHPGPAVRAIRPAWRAMRGMLGGPAVPGTSLDRPVGPDRSYALVRGWLDQVKGIAEASGSTVNDVLLTLVGGGLRELLNGRRELTSDLVLPMYVPITLRRSPAMGTAPGTDPSSGSGSSSQGNRIGQLVVRVPIAASDAAARLHAIATETRRLKQGAHPSVGHLLASRIVRRLLLKVLQRRPVSVTTADLPGPVRPMELAGARILEIFPVLPLIGSVSLGVGALSYQGQFNLLVVVDPGTIPDLAVFVRGARKELEALLAQFEPRQTPARTFSPVGERAQRE